MAYFTKLIKVDGLPMPEIMRVIKQSGEYQDKTGSFLEVRRSKIPFKDPVKRKQYQKKYHEGAGMPRMATTGVSRSGIDVVN